MHELVPKTVSQLMRRLALQTLCCQVMCCLLSFEILQMHRFHWKGKWSNDMITTLKGLHYFYYIRLYYLPWMDYFHVVYIKKPGWQLLQNNHLLLTSWHALSARAFDTSDGKLVPEKPQSELTEYTIVQFQNIRWKRQSKQSVINEHTKC